MVGVAALISGKVNDIRGKKVGTVVCGGNIDVNAISQVGALRQMITRRCIVNVAAGLPWSVRVDMCGVLLSVYAAVCIFICVYLMSAYDCDGPW